VLDVEPRTIAALVAALGFLFLSGAAAAVHDKVDEKKSAKKPAAPAGPVLAYPLQQSELSAFKGASHGGFKPLRKPLCLVQYFDSQAVIGVDRSYKWWTTCAQNAKFRTVDDVRNSLALPPDWGPRDARAVACVPSGATIPALRGRAGAQLSRVTGGTYPGGGTQYRVLRFDTRWIAIRSAVVPARASRLPPLRAPCGD
jgi:hypothetical protein